LENIKFFRSRSLDFVSFGFNSLRQGCQIGLPVSYFAKDQTDLKDLLPFDGFVNIFNQRITDEKIKEKLGNQAFEEFQSLLLLSNEAKQFGLAQAVAKTERTLKSYLDILVDVVCIMVGYSYCYIKNQIQKPSYKQRQMMYLGAFMMAVVVDVSSRWLIRSYLDRIDDTLACSRGLDCCEGSLEYYDKLIARNKMMRLFIDDGRRLIDEEGNYLKKAITVPLVNKTFYINYFGKKLTDRRAYCKAQLIESIHKYDDTSKLDLQNKSKEDDLKQKEIENKEWPIFKKLRILLENKENSKKK
jgi:hypothetical protein